MANQEHVARLKRGVEGWNQWREENPDIRPDLSGADLVGTDLRHANLNYANLNYANLEGAHLSFAGLNYTNLNYANLNYTNLSDANLSDANLSGVDFSEVDLRGAILSRVDLYKVDFSGLNLSAAVLSGANLSEAILNDADLSAAILSGALLATVQALGADFTGATLTGACIEDWHINADTELDGVVCDYIYLKRNQQERRPSDPNQTFAPGEFTKLFQKAHETLDLIFRHGVDWKAFAYAFGQLQIENEADELAIASIENKGDGVVVIRIKATPEADRPKLHGDFIQVYEVVHKTLASQFQERLEDKDRHINQLFALLQTYQAQDAEVKRLMAENQGTNFNISGPVGNVAGTIQSGGRQQNIQHIHAAPPQQTLSEAAAEIQALLQQLEQTNPTATEADQKAFVNAALPPTTRTRILGAAQAGGLAVLEETQYGKIIKAIIEGWQQAGK